MKDEFAELPSGGESDTDPREYLALLLKHIWLMLIVIAACIAGGAYYAAQQPPVYEASAKIVIDTSSPRILSEVAPVVDTGSQSYWALREYMETQYRILQSASISGEVAGRLGLNGNLEFLGLAEIEDETEIEAILENLDVARIVQGAVSIEPVQDSRVVTIRSRAGDPEIAAALSNMTANVYIERNLSRQLESTDSAAEWLDGQYVTLEDELTRAEEALVEFRREHDIIAVALSDHLSLTARMDTTSRQLAEARLEADRTRATVVQIDAAVAAGDLYDVDIPALVENDLIQGLKSELYDLESERIALSARYLEAHPLMMSVVERETLARERLEREIGNVLDSYRAQADAASGLARSLQRRLDEVENEVQQLGTHQVEYAALTRDATANRDLFDMIERRRKEVELTRNSQYNNVELLEEARVPNSPVAPNKLLIVAAAGVLGLILAVLLALLLEMLDSTVKNQEVIEREFGLTFLGLIPMIRPALSARPSSRGPARGQKWTPDLYVHDFPKSTVAESCRSIRTNLTFLASESPLDTLLITSPGPREGKTTSCLNMATVMAQSGTRVLLVDTDLRRPRVHTAFEGWHNDYGLSSMLTAGMAGVDAIRKTRVENLDILTSGPVPPNPAELLESDRFREVVAELLSQYDRVVFDSPPVTPVTDAAILAGVMDGVVLVVRASSTSKEMMGRAVELLTAVNANLVGVVLNDVDLTRRRNGSYYYYYYRQYAQYYGEEQDAA